MSRMSIPVKRETRDRLLAYSNRGMYIGQSYDEAVTELLDQSGFPQLGDLPGNNTAEQDTPLNPDPDADQPEFTPSTGSDHPAGPDGVDSVGDD